MLAVEVAGLDWLPSTPALVAGVLFTVGLALTAWVGWTRDPRASYFLERLNTDRRGE